MRAYLCVYRQPIKRPIHVKRTRSQVNARPELEEYLSGYEHRFRDSVGRFYDWGDDPSFFAAEHFLGDIRRASWGVCRHNVRSLVAPGDYVIFFCARQQQEDKARWDYYYVGVGTVEETISDRTLLWRKKKYRKYRKFYNLLIDSKNCHKEIIHEHHDDDWEERVEAPYVIFDGSKENTHFNVVNPLLVATYRTGEYANGDNVMETWFCEDKMVRRLHGLIPRRSGGKLLRTAESGNSHAHMNYADLLDHDERKLKRNRRKLIGISEEVAAE
ncbi:MAG: hypothetical protein OXC95_13385 [Dehalococcoidia bacterium]|nr:hypothetical protein [Dehalococcoidia bacterium]